MNLARSTTTTQKTGVKWKQFQVQSDEYDAEDVPYMKDEVYSFSGDKQFEFGSGDDKFDVSSGEKLDFEESSGDKQEFEESSGDNEDELDVFSDDKQEFEESSGNNMNDCFIC
ncbi:hypothetical protein RR48_01219 [Papilio machaon]|uniref:Uncharacterized protein n=1 Tax=Papilio machaon TaxID=76193 RepID=A0A0N1PI08_PAPMA|nr:hypothetical protein RR48_01219 [Papilio machaon]